MINHVKQFLFTVILNFNLVIYYAVKSMTSVSSDIVIEQRVNIQLAHKITPERVSSDIRWNNFKYWRFYTIQQRNQSLKREHGMIKWGENIIMKGKLADNS